ncbi:MAG: phage tail tape measure protein, partial [Nitrosopumilus sp.]
MAVGSGVHNLSLVIRGKNSASRALRSVAGDMGFVHGAARKMGTIFAAASKIAIAAIVAVGVAVVVLSGIGISQFARFEDALVGSVAIMGDVSEEQYERMGDAAREMAKQSRFSAEETAGALFFLASAGLDVERIILALPAVTRFAQAGLFDMSLATSLLTDAQSALGLKVDDASENLENMIFISDILVGANSLADATTQEFAEALVNQAAVAARQFNIPLEEVVATLAVFAENGFKGVVAGEKFFNVVRDLQKGAINNADAWSDMNIEVFDSTGKFRSVIAIIKDLEREFEDLSDIEKKQALMDLGFQERVQKNILQLLGFSDTIQEFKDELEDMGGTTEEVANKQLRSLSAQMDIFKCRIADVFIELGEKLAPAIKDFLPKLATWAEDIGPKVIEFIIEWNRVMVIIFHALVEFWKEGVVPAIDAIKDFLTTSKEVSDGVIDAFDAIIRWFSREFGPFFLDLWFKNILPMYESALLLITISVEGFISFFQDIWRKYGELILALFKDSWRRIKNVLRNAIDIIKGIIDLFIAIFTLDWGAAWEAINTIAAKAQELLTDIFFAIANLIAVVVIVAVEGLGDVWGVVWDGLKTAASNGWNLLTGWWDTTVAPWISNTWNA